VGNEVLTNRAASLVRRLRIAFLFPGQGEQYEGMLHALSDHPAARSTMQEANAVLGKDSYLLDSKTALQSTVSAQLCIFIAGVAFARVMESEGAMPDAVAGLSVGAFAAAVTAGVVDFAALLPVIHLRAEMMESAFPVGYGLSVILGLTLSEISGLVRECHSANDPVYLANLNGPRQFVIAGSVRGQNQVLQKAKALGAGKAEPLPVTTPSHCPLLKGVSHKLLNAISDIQFRQPRIPYVSNRNARLLRSAQAILEDVATNVEYPVYWYDSMTILYEQGVRLFVEAPPGQSLSKLVVESLPECRALAFQLTPLRSLLYRMAQESKSSCLD